MFYILIAVVLTVLLAIFYFKLSYQKRTIVLSNQDDLIKFLRQKYSCQIKHNQPIFALVVKDASIQKTLHESNMGELGRSVIDVQVDIVTQEGLQTVDAPCGNVKAEFNSGDLVAVLPTYNERHEFWYYIIVAKLLPTYEGKKKSWIILENYIH